MSLVIIGKVYMTVLLSALVTALTFVIVQFSKEHKKYLSLLMKILVAEGIILLLISFFIIWVS